MKIYRPTDRAIVMLLARLVKNGVITEKEADEVCGEPLSPGRVAYPEPFLDWFNLYPDSGRDGFKKGAVKKSSYQAWLKHGFGDDQEEHERLMAATKAYKVKNPDGSMFVKNPNRFIADDVWEAWVPTREVSDEPVTEFEGW